VALYVPVGVAVWAATLESGVHATIAGVALGLLTPTGRVGGRELLTELEHRLHPVSSFAAVPLFALANAGVYLGGGALGDAVSSRLAWGVAVGLILGKLAGVRGAIAAGLRLRVGILPAGVRRDQAWGVAALGGIGFTVSLFIAGLAYDDPALQDQAKVGIFAGSIISGLLGAAALMRRPRSTPSASAAAARGRRP
jgi:NhaA family Na+:H+ antiporter